MTYRRHAPDPHTHDRNRGQRLPSMLGAESFARLARVAQKVAPPEKPTVDVVRDDLKEAQVQRRFASIAEVQQEYRSLGGGLYTKTAGARVAHSIWELRGAQEGEGYVLVRKREERAADLQLADTAGRGTAAAVDAGIVRQARTAQAGGALDGAIIEAMARTLFVDAWAFAMEERGETHGWAGQDLMDLAPETSSEAKAAAAKLAAEFVALNGKSLTDLLEAAAAADGDAALNPSYVESFGHNLAMQAIGHGVSWFDDHAKFPIEFPRSENDVFFDDEDALEAEAMAPRAGAKVRAVRHGAIADAVIVVMKPEIGAAELLFGDGAQEDVPVDMILDLTSVGGPSMDPDGAAPIVIGSDDVVDSDPFDVTAAADGMLIEDIDQLIDVGQQFSASKSRDRNMQAAHAQGLKACEICGKAIKNFQTASKIVGTWIGPECAKQLRAAGYTWSDLFVEGARRIAMLKRSVDFASGFRPGSVVETTRPFEPFHHPGIEVPAGTEFTVEGFHTPKDDPMFGFEDLGRAVPQGTDFQNLRLRLTHEGGGTLVVTMNEFAQDFELARGQESEPEYGELPSVEETMRSRAPTVRDPGSTVVDRMPTTDELAPTYVGGNQPTQIRAR